MATILTTTGVSLYNSTKNSTRPAEPTVDQMRQNLRLNPEKASSEANSLLKIAKLDDYLVLFHTKTSTAIQCVNLLQKYFEAEGYKHVRLVALDFEEKAEQIEKTGLRDLVNMLIKEIRDARRNSQDIIINATAGFKAQVVYSTMVGMLYQIPVKYMYEDFKTVMTINPIPLEWDTSVFLTYTDFFEWLNEEPRQQQDVENRLKPIYDREQLEALLESPDADGEVFLSPMGEALWGQFKQEEEEAKKAVWPASAEIDDIESKITQSIRKHHQDKKKGTKTWDFCLEIASIDCVQAVTGKFSENTVKARIKQAYPNGTITLLWAGGEKAQNITVQTTAQGKPQTLKVAEKIREILEKYR